MPVQAMCDVAIVGEREGQLISMYLAVGGLVVLWIS